MRIIAENDRATKEALDFYINSPRMYHQKCIANSWENLHTYVKVLKVKAPTFPNQKKGEDKCRIKEIRSHIR